MESLLTLVMPQHYVNKQSCPWQAEFSLIQTPHFSLLLAYTSTTRKAGKEIMEELLQKMLSLASFDHPGVIVALLFLVVLFLYWCGTRGFADLKKLNVPGPKPIPFLGNMLEAKKYGGLYLMHLDYFKKYGKVFGICLGGRPSLVVGDPELLKQIMVKNFPIFHNRFQIQPPSNKKMAKNVLVARDDT